ncbi:MAG TPA: immunoglobulin domain-containing protein [Opitutaceae bacterium]|jgi:YVTN family beta-propeller protein|nr:immunoglobulin domain-containing protein [Opitutaceae bacterium]
MDLPLSIDRTPFLRGSRLPSLILALFAAAFSGSFARAQSVETTLTVGPNIYAVAVNPVTNKIYVVNHAASGTVTVIDGATNAMTSVPVGGLPNAIDINTVTNRIYVANNADGTVSVIDGGSNAVVATVPTGANPIQVVVNAKANHTYVMNELIDGTETVIDGSTNAVVDKIFGGNDPTFIAVDPTTDMLYVVAVANNDYPSIITPTLYSALGLVPNVPAFNGFDTIAQVLTAENVFSMAADPVTDQVVTACVGGNGIFVLDMDAQGLLKSYKQVAQGNFSYIAINSVTGIAYVTTGGDSLYAVNLATDAVSQASTQGLLISIAVDQNHNEVYAAVHSGPGTPGTVYGVDGATNAVTPITVGPEPFAVAVNPVTDKTYVLNGDGTISVIGGTGSGTVPSFSFQPQSQTAAPGATVAFNVVAASRPSASYQWSLNGVPLADGAGVSGSTTGTLVLTGVTAASAGSYSAVASNTNGHAGSSAATLTVSSTAVEGRIINLSTRALIDNGRGVDGAQVLIAGFVIQGTGSKSVILRGVGPTLSKFGVVASPTVPGAVQHPDLTLFDSAVPANVITGDLGWQSALVVPTGIWTAVAPVDATAADFAGVGAFALPAGSGDSAIKVTLPPGAYTTQITTADIGIGIVLAEVYDEDTGTPSSRLVNISSRSYLSSGASAMIAGFVISGETSKTVLIRASGPALAKLGVGSVATYPNVLLFDGSGTLIASNDKWGGSPQIAAAAAKVGAFAWTDTGSQDAAVLVTLPPGAYTAEVNPTINPYGNALIEVYEVP